MEFYCGMRKHRKLMGLLYYKMTHLLLQSIEQNGYEQIKNIRKYYSTLSATVRQELLYLGLFPHTSGPGKIKDRNQCKKILSIIEVLFSFDINFSLKSVLEEDYFEKILQCVVARGKRMKSVKLPDKSVCSTRLQQSGYFSIISQLISN